VRYYRHQRRKKQYYKHFVLVFAQRLSAKGKHDGRATDSTAATAAAAPLYPEQALLHAAALPALLEPPAAFRAAMDVPPFSFKK
jgi:hypothetical protein